MQKSKLTRSVYLQLKPRVSTTYYSKGDIVGFDVTMTMTKPKKPVGHVVKLDIEVPASVFLSESATRIDLANQVDAALVKWAQQN